MLYHKKYKTREDAHRDIFWYIEVFYNRKRRHQALGYLTPAEFKRNGGKLFPIKQTVQS
ncbi:MAG TPA: IS3 family transposase [Syntrophomonadaceae bacterium]|nr:IS3 family transposase [Syntrophomonadaceae bacterium]